MGKIILPGDPGFSGGTPDQPAKAPDIFIPGVSDEDHPSGLVEKYNDAKWERHPHGIVIVNGREVATTLQCCHCGLHFVSRKGSGITRGFCMRCEAVTCGKKECVEACRPWVESMGMSQGRML